MSAPALSAEALAVWEDMARLWDDTIADGNGYWKCLQEPALGRFLGEHLARPSCRALDLATGNGLCARWLVSKGASFVLATDGSENMLERARGRMVPGRDDAIVLRKLDVTQAADFDALLLRNEPPFDVVLINMAIMDIATLDPLVRALPKLLAKDGVFAASVLHPVFFTSGASKNLDIRPNPETGEMEVVRTKVIKNYLFIPPVKGEAFRGQPRKQIYFHRPMHELFAVFFKTGLVMDAMEEPAFTNENYNPERVDDHSNYTQLPAILAWRMRLA
ncbi:S-adenosyl-L-methionine-dependent methyltransferase [Podospora didyma]|uniref:S-adenosyl-L-methionine-dependent methyltransferase n=1 Tax=Podospora didyma TaxID=330526 RepID=A0AAE0NQX1_9PEZI|nr:S-adenosyl-L-methionine-dependent methyltransferase [Podospora didyma]